MKRILVGIPTLNEANNVGQMVARLEKLALPLDILFVDDNSQDGTGKVLDQMARANSSIRVMHRPAALGIGSAHQAILEYAYEHHYETLVTMDCDFSHQPEDLPRLLATNSAIPIAVGSRFLDPRSLEEWNIKRKCLTHLGHWLTARLLRLPMDATGAFRLYRLERIPKKLWAEVRSRGYAFFFESLVVLQKSGFRCAEISIRLPKRVYGESKLSFLQTLKSLRVLLLLCLGVRGFPGASNDAKGWDHYWKAGHSGERRWYAVLASLYRRAFIVGRLRDILNRNFSPGVELYHVGCGGGEVDEQAYEIFKIIAVDISSEARKLYAFRFPGATILNGDILQGPLEKPLVGLYSLGLVEHFFQEEIIRILTHMRQSLLPGGKIVLFWPHRHAPSVYFLRAASWIRERVGAQDSLHPPEPSLLRSRQEAESLAERAGCRLVQYDFGPRDLWIQAAIVLEAKSRVWPEPTHSHFEKQGAKQRESAH
jgi:dolichol-phosphate mannosyltransferase